MQSQVPSRSEGVPLSILLVDDDLSFIGMISRELALELGHRTMVATSAEEAKKLLEQDPGRFHVVFLDYDMPGENGLEVLRWMRESGVRTPVVMLTGAGSEDVAIDAMKLGAYDYIRKEHIDLSHLDILVKATHERHQFRIAKELEEERMQETGLTQETTERMREVVAAIAQTLNGAFAAIEKEAKKGERQATTKLKGAQKEEAQAIFADLRRYVSLLEGGLGGVLKLYNVVYAHHAGREEIQQIKDEFVHRVGAIRGQDDKKKA